MKSILQSSSMDTEFSKIKNLEIQRTSFIIFKYLKKKKLQIALDEVSIALKLLIIPTRFHFDFRSERIAPWLLHQANVVSDEANPSTYSNINS